LLKKKTVEIFAENPPLCRPAVFSSGAFLLVLHASTTVFLFIWPRNSLLLSVSCRSWGIFWPMAPFASQQGFGYADFASKKS
jgi:hypothetical protein